MRIMHRFGYESPAGDLLDTVNAGRAVVTVSYGRDLRGLRDDEPGLSALGF